jgi:hypothetical protein
MIAWVRFGGRISRSSTASKLKSTRNRPSLPAINKQAAQTVRELEDSDARMVCLG